VVAENERNDELSMAGLEDPKKKKSNSTKASDLMKNINQGPANATKVANKEDKKEDKKKAEDKKEDKKKGEENKKEDAKKPAGDKKANATAGANKT